MKKNMYIDRYTYIHICVYVYIYRTASLFCIAEISTTL